MYPSVPVVLHNPIWQTVHAVNDRKRKILLCWKAQFLSRIFPSLHDVGAMLHFHLEMNVQVLISLGVSNEDVHDMSVRSQVVLESSDGIGQADSLFHI